MSRKESGLFGNLLFISSKLPWAVNIALAVASYFALHSYVAPGSAPVRSVRSISVALSTQIFLGAASILQYVLPLIFIAGAIASLFMRAKRRSEPNWNPSTTESRVEPTLGANKTAIHTGRFSLELLRSIDWKRFEEVCAEYFRVIGFRAVTQSHGPDGGIDIVLYSTDAPNNIGALVQCKRWTKQVGPKAVRELLGVMTDRKVDQGIFVTTSSFNEEATALARANHIDLINGESLLRQIRLLTAEQQQRLLNVATEGDFLTPTCASCGIKLVLRENSKDKSKFWGCRNYPRCRSKLYVSAVTEER